MFSDIGALLHMQKSPVFRRDAHFSGIPFYNQNIHKHHYEGNAMKNNILSTSTISRLGYIRSLIQTIERSLANYPEGILRIKTKGDATYYYRSDHASKDYGEKLISDDTKLIRQLAQRSYLERVLRAARHEEKILRNFEKQYGTTTIEDIYERLSPQRRALIDPITLPDDEYVKKWLDVPYEPKGFLETDPYFITANQERVRSKSEQLIADRLRTANIPYRYECPLNINGVTFYPDFTILRMSDRQVIYLEHLGMMDNPDYANNAIRKMNTYSANGLIVGKNLFTTMESSRHPLDIRTVDNLIDSIFR